MGDYVRQLPHHGSRDMAKRPSVIMRLHIDVPLLLLLLLTSSWLLHHHLEMLTWIRHVLSWEQPKQQKQQQQQ